MDNSDNTLDEEMTVALAMVTTAMLIDEEEGEESADALSHLTLSTAFDHRDDPPYNAQVMAYLASYAAVLLRMVGEAVDTAPSEIHQSMALAMHTTEESA